VLGVEAPIIAALLHNLATFIGLGNAGRLLLFDETHPGALQSGASGPVPAASASGQSLTGSSVAA
jgi:hypothetical protein